MEQVKAKSKLNKFLHSKFIPFIIGLSLVGFIIASILAGYYSKTCKKCTDDLKTKCQEAYCTNKSLVDGNLPKIKHIF